MKKTIVTGKLGKTTYVRKITEGKNIITFIPNSNRAYYEMQRFFQERKPEIIVVEEANINNHFCEMLFCQEMEHLLYRDVEVILVMQRLPEWALNRTDIQIIEV